MSRTQDVGFLDLYDDILKQITKEASTRDLLSLTRTTKRLQRASIQPLCENPITFQEFEAYYQRMSPWTFGVFCPEKTRSYKAVTYTQVLSPKNSLGKDLGFYAKVSDVLGLEPNQQREDFNYDYENEEAYNEFSFDNLVGTNNLRIIVNGLPEDHRRKLQYDLFSQFHIYQERLGCMKNKETYAREKVLQNFDAMVQAYQTGIANLPEGLIAEDWRTLIPSSIFHLYLYQQCRCLNIVPAPTAIEARDYILSDSLDIVKGPDWIEEENQAYDELSDAYDIMVEEIELLTPKVRWALERLE